MTDANEHIEKMMLELRRGTITIGVLSQLSEPQYGYSLVKMLGDNGIQVEPGTLYPLLRRLEKQGLLKSEWDTDVARPRKYYVLSETGHEVYRLLCVEWEGIVKSLDHIINRKGDGENGVD